MKELANKKKLGTKTWFFAVVYPFRAHFLKKFGVFAHVGNFVHYFFYSAQKSVRWLRFFFFFFKQKGVNGLPFFFIMLKKWWWLRFFFLLFSIKKGQQNENDRYYPRGPKITTPAASRWKFGLRTMSFCFQGTWKKTCLPNYEYI